MVTEAVVWTEKGTTTLNTPGRHRSCVRQSKLFMCINLSFIQQQTRGKEQNLGQFLEGKCCGCLLFVIQSLVRSCSAPLVSF